MSVSRGVVISLPFVSPIKSEPPMIFFTTMGSAMLLLSPAMINRALIYLVDKSRETPEGPYLRSARPAGSYPI